MDPTNGKLTNGRERTYFKPGNKAAVGHGPPTFEALRRRALRHFLQIDVMLAMLEDSALRAMDGDLAEKKFLMDYSGLKPIESVSVDNSGHLFARLGIEVIGKENNEIRE